MSNRRRIIALVTLAVVLLLSFFLLGHYWYQPTYSYVYTDNARIDGTMVDVVAKNGGQVMQLPYDTGDRVEKSYPVATLKITLATSAPSSGAASILSSPEGTTEENPYYMRQNILAPLSGIVAGRWVNLGDTVLPGQRLLTIIDPDDIWVIANIDENEIQRVKPGQRVDIHVDATNETLPGSVEYVMPLTTSVVQQPPESSIVVAANTQDVPVKILFQQKGNYLLYPGLSTEVTIYTK
jgi:multidrug resistance efflux pump